jgi:hypothetical protein
MAHSLMAGTFRLSIFIADASRTGQNQVHCEDQVGVVYVHYLSVTFSYHEAAV